VPHRALGGFTVFDTFFREKLAPLTLRLAVGLVCVYHGFTKIMANGGLTWNASMPTHWQAIFAWAEFSAGVAILLGFRCRLAATTVLALLVSSLLWSQGWNVLNMPLGRLEPILLMALVGLSLLFLGAGDLSLDARSGGASPAARTSSKKRSLAA
jgi:uncharacterized membrane protein YphA (DoxX/SURF4 family)